MASMDQWVPDDAAMKLQVLEAESVRSVGVGVGATTADGSVDFRGRAAERGATGGWKTSPSLFGAAMFEAVVNLGIAFNLSLYLLGPMRLQAIPAATALSNYLGASYLTSLLGGFVSDAVLGNYWTIIVAMLVELVGVAVLIVSSMPECVMKERACLSVMMPECGKMERACLSAKNSLCMFALYLIAVGAGSIRPCLSAFAGDQFDQEDAAERRQTPGFFNWLVVSITSGGVVATTLVAHLAENVSWTWSFAALGLAMAAATVCFLAGTPRYRHLKPAGSPATRILQVFVAAFRNRKRKLPEDQSKLHEINAAKLLEARDGKPYYLLRHTTGMRILDKAAVIGGDETASDPWRLCTVTQVEELKGLLRCVPIAMSTTLLYMVLAQVQTWTIQQGYVMERRVIGARSSYLIPPATLSAVAIAVVLLEVAAYDFLLVPALRRITRSPHGLSHLRRIGTGLALSVVGLGYAALLEFVRLDMAPVRLSVFWQLPILVAMGSAIFFAHAGLFEFFYYESPARMRSLGTALSMVPIALGLFQNGGFLAGVNSATKKLAGRGWLESPDLNHNHLDYFYVLMATMSSINLVVFLITARFYEYKQFINAASNPDDLSLDNFRL